MKRLMYLVAMVTALVMLFAPGDASAQYYRRRYYRRPVVVYQRPVYQRPVYQRPVYQRPVYQRPVYYPRGRRGYYR